MRTISRRLEKLEKTLAFLVEEQDDGGAARIRAWIRGLATQVGDPVVEQLEKFLDEVGPEGFHLELIRGHLIAHGFPQHPNESLAETMSRAAGIAPVELKARLREGRTGMAFVLDRIGLRGQPVQAATTATDNG